MHCVYWCGCCTVFIGGVVPLFMGVVVGLTESRLRCLRPHQPIPDLRASPAASAATKRDIKRQRERDIKRERETERDIKRETERDIKRERDRERHKERDRDRERHKERERQRET